MCVMKKLLISSIVILFAETLMAQTTAEWTSQKKTQKKYLAQQIAALHVYANFLSKWYAVVKRGLHTIQKIKYGDLDLHADHFASLLKVNPKIKRYVKVADIIFLEISITKQTGSVLKRFNSSKDFTGEEETYLHNIGNNILRACSNNLDELSNLISGGNLQLKDDERIAGIDKIYADMKELQMFTGSFFNNASGLSVQRHHEENEIIVSEKLNGVKWKSIWYWYGFVFYFLLCTQWAILMKHNNCF